MPTLQEVLADPNYVNANFATKQAIFNKYASQDPNYAGANDATRAAIRQRYGVERPVAQEIEAPAAPKPIPEATYGEAVTDVGGRFVRGIGSLVQLPGQVYGLATGDFSKTGFLGAGEKIREFGEEMLSPTAKAKEAAREQKVAEAEKQGILPAAGTAFMETVKDPSLLVGFLVEQLPQLIPALLTGGGTAALTAAGIASKEAAALVASGAAKEAAQIAAKQIAAKKAGELGVRAAVGTGAVQQGADIGAGSYEEIYKAAIEKGMSEPEAAKTALGAARAAGASGALISLLAQRLPGARTLEESFAGVRGTTGRLLGAGKGLLGESASEIAEEGGGRFSQNLAMREVNPEQDLSAGIGQAAGMAAIGGGAMGAIAGGLRRPAEPTEAPPKVEKPSANLKTLPKPFEVPDIPEPPDISAAPPTAKVETLPPAKVETLPPEVELKPTDLNALTNYTEGLPDESSDVFQRLQNRDRATPASIQQMQGIASNPDYDRLKTSPDFGSGAPVVISDIKIPEIQMGRQELVTASDGRKVPVQYAVVSAGDLLTSHTASGQTNAEYGNVTTPGIRAVAGNGRIAGLQAAYGNDTAANYLAGLQSDTQHGIDPATIEGVQNPVLVRVMPKSYVTPDIGDVSNVAGQLRLNPVEAAKNDINRFDLQGLQYNEDGSINNNSVIQFVRSMPKEEQGELIDKNGIPNAIAIDRLNNAVFYKAYGSDSLIDLYAQAADPEAKLILQGLAKAAGKVSQLEGAGEYDIRKNIIEAAELAVNARRQGIKLKDFVTQGQIGLDPNTLSVLEMFAENGRSGKRMGELLGDLADAAYQANEQGGEDMFGDKVQVPLTDVFKALKGQAEGPDLFTKPEPKELPEPKDFVAKKSMEEIAKEIKGMTATQLAQWAVDNAPNSAAKAIAEKVLVRIKELDKRDFFKKPVSVLNRDDLSYRGRFTYALDFSYGYLSFAGLKNGKVHSGTGTRYITILHELIHAATVPALSAQGKEYNDLMVVLDKVKKQIEADQKAGKTHPIFAAISRGANTVKNVKELVTWGLTHPEFQDYLSTVKVGETNAMTRMIEIFRKLLGLDAKYETALDAVVRAADTLIEMPTETTEKAINKPIGAKKVTPPAAPKKPAAKKVALEKPSFFKTMMPNLGFQRLPQDSDRVYEDKGGKAFPTFERNGVRVALSSNNILYLDERNKVNEGYGEPDEVILRFLGTDPSQRKKGLASSALKDIVDGADQSGVTLYIEPVSLDKQGLSDQDLIKLYKKFGFEEEGGNKILVRRPAGKVEEKFEEESLGEKVKAKVGTALQKRKPLAPESFQGVSPDFIEKANPIFAPQKKTIIDRLTDMQDRFWQRAAQNIADQFRTIKEYSEQAYILARMSKTVDGALEGLMFFGQVFNDGGALNIKQGTKGLIEILKPLGNEVDRYQMWVALNREADLPPNKRSKIDNLDDLVARRNELMAGEIDGKPREQVYKAVRTEMNKLNRSVLKVALDSGLIDSTANAIDRLNGRIQDTLNNDSLSDAKKEKEIEEFTAQIEELQKNPIGYERFAADINYIPFYREMEDGDVSKAMTASGLGNQHFSKALEGGVSPFADLTENTLRNWSHILSASMKNQAAAATLEAAQRLGGAEPNLKPAYYMIDGLVYTRSNDKIVGDGSVKSWMTDSGNQSVKVMIDGQPTYFKVLDPLLLDSIASIGYMGPKSKFLDVARGFKNVLQYGVTLSPAFKVNNLIRDSVSAMAVSDLKKTPISNVLLGLSLSKKDSPTYIAGLAGGAIFNFGSIVEGDQAKLVKRLVKMGVKEENILDTTDKIKSKLKYAFDKYQDYGNRSEAANRLALYQQMKDKGYNHLEASFYARDLLDFSMQGSWPAFRLLTQVVPFLNARVQGLYKLGRDGINPTVRVFYNSITGKPIEQTDKQKAQSFGIVTTAVCLASLALYFAFKDDEEYKKRDDWDRDNFWWFKLPGMEYALRVPKPFEIGAFGTLTERIAEQIFDQGAEGKQFEAALGRMITDTFALNLPQFIKPMVDLYANKDSFTGAPIESAGMERLSKQERETDNTSPLAIALGGISKVALPGEGLSPVQMDYAIKAYFGWLGGFIASSSHYAVMPFKEGAYPDTKMIDKFSAGLIKSLPSNQSKYVTAFYESNKEISQAYADMRHYAEIGESDKVQKILEEKGDKISLAKFYDKTAKNMANIRKQIRLVTNDPTMDGATKREEIDRLKALISMLAEQAEDTRKAMK